ncbi:MAG: FxsA family protein [Alphaproteobacteria bacterium]|jgi:UPF0716 protein FxsA
MGWILFLLFVALPIAEIALFIQAGDLIGLWPTIGLVILTAAVGAALARSEGRAAMQRLSAAVEGGGAPVGPLLDAAAIFAGGLMLLTPGFITDTIGLSLLFQPTRFLWGQFFAWMKRRRRRGGSGHPGGPTSGHWPNDDGRPNGGHDAGPVIIEGDYVIDPETSVPPKDRLDR